MKKFKAISPYNKAGKTTFPETQKKSGVYLIFENTKLVYIGYSGNNLYKTMYRHFQTWNHPQQPVVSYKSKLNKKDYTIRIILCTPAQAYRLERLLIKKHKPRDNQSQYEDYNLTKVDSKLKDEYDNIPLSKLSEIVPF